MVKIMLDTTQYTQKPQGNEVGKIQNRLKPVNITIPKLAQYLIAGCSFKPAFLNGKKEKDWISQQIFCLDFDENTTIQTELDRCKQLNILPAFGYTSFSHTEQHHKFRLVFVSDHIITDYNTAKQVQLILMQLFNTCDEQCSNLSRLYFGGKQLIYSNYNNVIDYEELLNKYGTKQTEPDKKRVHNNRCNKNSSLKTDNINYNILAIKNLDVETMRKLVNSNIESCRGFLADYKTKIHNTLVYQSAKNPYIAQNRNEVYKIIDSIDLADFLGIENPSNFKCIIHDDHNPSANIYKTDDGTDIYKCFGCGFTGGIIKIVEKIADCSKIDAINFIKSVYNIELIQSQWQKTQIEILETNKDYLLSGKMEIEYPQLWKYVKPRLTKLIAFIDIAIRNIYDEELSYNGMPVFYASLSQIQNVFETNSRDTANKNINLFCLLHLIQKVQLDNIPKNMLLKAQEWAKKKKFNKIPNHYQIPAYDNKTLEQSELNAKILQDNNFTMKGISREWVIRTFGEEVANKIYPQYKRENAKGTTKASDERTNKIAQVIMQEIEKNGYVTEKQVIEQLKHKYGKALTQTQLKRSLQEILNNYNLKRIRCNKQLKQKYGITSKGYPFLIVKN